MSGNHRFLTKKGFGETFVKRPYVSLCCLLVIASACKRNEPSVREVSFETTTYNYLGDYDTTGRPTYLLPADTISNTLLSFIKKALPDQKDLRSTNPDLLSKSASTDIRITKSADVYITFVLHGAFYTNSFAFYTYPTNQPPQSPKEIKSITYIFPNSGGGSPLKPGDKVKIGHFESGTSIGFVLLQKAWNATQKKIDNKVMHFCSDDLLNPEVEDNLKKHSVIIQSPADNKMFIGFEDMIRTDPTCDHDFNDVIFYCTTK